jgi:DNA-binding MarR family transcriptional regulator
MNDPARPGLRHRGEGGKVAGVMTANDTAQGDNAAADERLEELVTAFAQAARLMDGPRLHVWDERGLTLPQLRILFRIRQQPGIGVREMAQAFGVSASNITQQVDKLVARGLVARADRPEDRRQVAHTLTAEGELAATEISQAARAYLAQVLGRLPPGDQAQLTRLLRRLLDVAAEPIMAPTPERARGR